MSKIRLTESQLHKIIKESVKEILSEGSLNELDPRTYASYAQKRAAQGGLRNQWKAANGQQAAVNAWNNQYGDNTYSSNNLGSHSEQTFMGNNYNVQTNTNDNGVYGDERTNSQRNYDPHNDSYNFERNQYDYYGNQSNMQKQGNGAATKGERVARQMAQGNGKYIKGQGWQ